MSDEHLNLAKQPSHVNDGITNELISSGPVYPDEELVRRAKNDDPWAIEQLVLKYQKKVYTIAFQMLSGDAEDARDRTQDAFLQAFRRIKQFKEKSSFYTWLYRIVINTCIDARRRRRRWKEIFIPWHFEKNKGAGPETSLEEFPDTGREVENHLEICEGCRLEHRRLLSILAKVRETGVAPELSPREARVMAANISRELKAGLKRTGWRQYLSPQEKNEMRQRMDRLNNMSPRERKAYKQLHKKWQHLPPGERKQLQKELENWENLSPKEQESIRRRFMK